MLIKNARVIDPYNQKDEITDIRTGNGCVAQLGRDLAVNDNEEIIDATELIAAPGLVDVHSHFRDPGQTEKETLHTGALAAAAGGYTSVVCMANTVPAADSPEMINDILDRAGRENIHIYQDATISVGRNGSSLVDMKALIKAGAAGFTDDGSPITDEELVRRAMEKAAESDAVLSFHEEDPSYVWEAGINCGSVAEAMGLRGADRKAEYTMVERDIRLALDAGAKIDIQHVSAKESVEIIKRYKKTDIKGLIHAEATPHHFSLTEDMLTEKGSLAKVNPPLRTEEDRQAVIRGLADGTLDIIATDHAPHTAGEKNREFTKAPSGMIGLETALALGITNLVEKGHISFSDLIRLMSLNPAGLYGLQAGRLGVGDPADIVIFDPAQQWTVSEKDLQSRSKNSPFLGMTLKGRVRYTIVGGKTIYSHKGQT
ncbi:MAG: dihydroorotase [Lachnospiraceae bacterium]|nr:dihydroorotase [Lachnospiraceae bacterium]